MVHPGELGSRHIEIDEPSLARLYDYLIGTGTTSRLITPCGQFG
ncbi:hypothetical protein [Sciscionella marina]|nr:hypothetical protein [Sciscionella marina]